MSHHQSYQSLVNKYKNGAQFVKKLGTASTLIQLGIIGFANGWKHLEIPYYTIFAPLLFSLSIYFLIKDFLVFRRIDENIARMILEGVDLEKKNAKLGQFFHNILQSFNIAQILLQRSLLNVVALLCFSYWICQFITEVSSDFVINRSLLNVFLGILTAIAGKIYYDSFKDLTEAKEKIFAK